MNRFLFAPAHPKTVGLFRLCLTFYPWRIFRSYEGWELSGRLNHPEIRYYFETYFFTEP